MSALAASAQMLSPSWSSSAAKTARTVRMEQRVADDPLDADAWVVLLAAACEQAPADFRPLFERCVQHFPSAACVWYQWLEAEQRWRNLEAMEAIFERCLLPCPHVELWRLYLRYLRQEKQPRCSNKELQQAYEVLLGAVGQAVGSGPLWVEYVALVRDAVEPGMMPTSGPVTAARDAFQRALVQPAVGLEALWKDYEAWEGAQSGGNAKPMLAEIADSALVARRVAKERGILTAPLKLNRMPRVPRGSAAEFSELRAWRALWEYEATNPQRLSQPELQARMQFTFNQALMVGWFTPQVWHEAALWMYDNGHAQSAHSFYKRALEVLPLHETLALAYAQLHEAEGNPATARELLEQLVKLKPSSPLPSIHLMRLVRRSEGAHAARQVCASTPGSPPSLPTPPTSLSFDPMTPPRAPSLDAPSQVFARARRAEGCTWHIYAAAAQLERQLGSGGDGAHNEAEEEDGGLVASRILALALDRFSNKPALALHCVRSLIERNDAANARAVLERCLTSDECRKSKELWASYVEVEMTFGSPASVRAVEVRRASAHPELRVGSLYQLAAMHAFCGLWPSEGRQLRALAEETPPAPPSNSLAAGGVGNGEAAEENSVAPSAIIVPNLGNCVEYTGEPILLDPQDVGASSTGESSGGEDGAMNRMVPYQLEALIEALPSKRVAGALTEELPSPQAVQFLFHRLSRLPDKLADLPESALALGGSSSMAGGVSAAEDAGSKRKAGVSGRSADTFTARQRKKQQLGL
jgi:cleavage stimulation factor subunit 3